ncbi:hypothetical protein [Rhodococcus triatomae]
MNENLDFLSVTDLCSIFCYGPAPTCRAITFEEFMIRDQRSLRQAPADMATGS